MSKLGNATNTYASKLAETANGTSQPLLLEESLHLYTTYLC
ncbi:hypothetical protein [Flavobacterium soyae]|nr:hypothetical protein [Flavobacterium soyae]